MAERKRTTKQTELDKPVVTGINPELLKRVKEAQDEAYNLSIPIALRQEKLNTVLEWCSNNQTHLLYQQTLDKCIRLSHIIERTRYLLEFANIFEDKEYTWIDLHTVDSLSHTRVYTNPEYYNADTGLLLWEWIVNQIKELAKEADKLNG